MNIDILINPQLDNIVNMNNINKKTLRGSINKHEVHIPYFRTLGFFFFS